MFRKQHPAIGARPGTLVIAEEAPATKIRVVQYSQDEVREVMAQEGQHLRPPADAQHVTWIDVQGFANVQWLLTLAEEFQIHPLAIEDIVNVPQRPKAELYDGHELIIARTIIVPAPMDIRISQLSMILGPNYVITAQDQYSDTLNPIRRRVDQDNAGLRCNGSDYLAYSILDTVVDAYYPVLESLGEVLESLEVQVVERPHPQLLKQLNRIRNSLVNLRRCLWPQRDAVHTLLVDANHLIGDKTRTFLRDTHDHCLQTSEVVEMYREMASGLLNTYMSSVAHRSNEVMKVLTIMSSIFVPLTFVAGIYGMNFEHMPELRSAWGYPMVWLTMCGMAVGMLWFFRRKGWIGIFRFDDAGASRVKRGRPPEPSEAARRPHALEYDQQEGLPSISAEPKLASDCHRAA